MLLLGRQAYHYDTVYTHMCITVTGLSTLSLATHLAAALSKHICHAAEEELIEHTLQWGQSSYTPNCLLVNNRPGQALTARLARGLPCDGGQPWRPDALYDDAGYNSGTFYDPDSPSLGAWLEALPADIKAEGLGVAHLQQKTAHRVPGFITQGPEPIADLDSFRASVMKPPQPAVKLTHRYQLSQQAPKVHVCSLPPKPAIMWVSKRVLNLVTKMNWG